MTYDNDCCYELIPHPNTFSYSQVNGYRGIVIYYGNPHADPSKLNNPINARFMNNTAQVSTSSSNIVIRHLHLLAQLTNILVSANRRCSCYPKSTYANQSIP